MYRKTYVEVNLSHIKNNVSKIIKKYHEYQYYFGIVKAGCYGHQNQVIQSVIEGGCNYLAVALLEEALEIRKQFPKIPILCLGIITSDEVELCVQNQITITINSLEMAKQLLQVNCTHLHVHIKLNTGMNRLGISSLKELKEVMRVLENHVFIEGIYTHIYDAKIKERTEKQLAKFQELLTNIEYQKIPIIHVFASEALTNYLKIDYINGCRLGIIMYGFTSNSSLKLESTFSLYSIVLQIQDLEKGETVGYNGAYIAKEKERIAIVPIGYADGVIRKNTGRNVYINEKPYPIVGNICMDMLFIKIGDDIKVGDKVVLLKDNKHIEEVAQYLETIPYEIMCMISSRVPRIYRY